MNNVVGINSDELRKIILEIYEYRDKISKILDTAQILIEGTKTYYNSIDGEELRAKFENLASNFSIFLENIKSYGDDLQTVMSAYQNFLKNS